jgi:hypothetical protein
MVNFQNLKDGEKILIKELRSCIDADYVLEVTNLDGKKEIIIPKILLKEQLKNKDEYIDITMNSSWSAINGDMNNCEAWMFLNVDFGDLGVMKFKFNLFDMNVRRWIMTLILSSGKAILCDKNNKTNFDIGLSNIPLDIPLAQMTLTALFITQKRSAVGG